MQPVAPDTVVVEVDGKKLTAADIDKLLANYPPQVQTAIRANPGRSLTQVLLFQHLRELAEKEGLDQQAPYKQSLEYQRTAVLAQAEMNTARYRTQVQQADAEKVYKEHPERFREAKVRAIYIAFNPMAGRGGGDQKLPSEADAKAKAEELRKQIAAGADFGKLARENSDDKTSAAKDGDFGTIKKSSPYPDALKTTVLSLKQGEVSEPIRQSAGFYLIKVEDFQTQPLIDVSGPIMEEMRQASFDAWMKSLENRFSVKIENQSYFGPGPVRPTLPK
jgi:parvulin-like peptidyl-prolyl isomerase